MKAFASLRTYHSYEYVGCTREGFRPRDAHGVMHDKGETIDEELHDTPVIQQGKHATRKDDDG